jgi:hypothetical protein
MPLQGRDLLEYHRRRLKALKKERQGKSWDAHWQEISNYIHPRAIRLEKSRRNLGTKQNTYIRNSTATKASRVLSSGMHAGNTPPSRAWFRLGPWDPQMQGNYTVRNYLSDVRDILLESYARTNVYTSFPVVYENLGDFATACMLVLEDEQDIFRNHVLPIGSYWLSQDHQMRPDTLYRAVQLTARQINKRFPGRGSSKVRDAIRNNRLEESFEVMHCIEPNENANPLRFDAAGMPWQATWFEFESDEEMILGTGGYQEKPFMAPRWKVTGEDTYGEGPGLEALPDIKSLQHLEKRKAQLMDKLVNPPMQGPGSLRDSVAGLLPGMVTYIDSQTGQKFEPAFKPDPQALMIREDMAAYESRIEGAYYVDLFLMLANTAIPGMTAREVEERHEEKMLQLGPAIERINDEFLDPFIDRTFGILSRAGFLPDPPVEIQGQPTKVEYLSALSQAQKLIATVGIERAMAFVLQHAEVFQEMVDKVNADRVVDHYFEAQGVDPDMIRDQAEVDQIRAQRQQQIQAQQMAEMAAGANQAAGAARQMGQTDLTNLQALDQQLRSNGAPGVA